MPRLKNTSLRNYSLLLLSALLFVLSFVFNKLYTNRSSVGREVKLAEAYIREYEEDFSKFLKDTVLVNRLLVNQESLEQLSALTAKKYGIFLYSTDEFGYRDLKFWSKQLAVPDP